MLRKIETLIEPCFDTYGSRFKKAIINTKKYDLGDYIYWKQNKYKFFENEYLARRFTKYLKNSGWNIHDVDLINQCLTIHFYMKEFVDNFFETESILTIGYIIQKDGTPLYNKTFEERISCLKNNVDPNVPNKIHAWLTLPSLEIMDFTYFSSMSKKYNEPSLYGKVICEFADDESHHKYIPQIVGTDYLFKAGFLRKIK